MDNRIIAITALIATLSVVGYVGYPEDTLCTDADVHFNVSNVCTGFSNEEYIKLKASLVSEYDRTKEFDFDIGYREILKGVLDYELAKNPIDFQGNITLDNIKVEFINLLK